MSHFSDALAAVAAEKTELPRARLAAFVPIAIALIGVGVVLTGGISATPKPGEAIATAAAIDPVTTGTVAPAVRADALARLDD
jgi:hypothetical protein